ncbi:hypothetical protein [Planotetraspora sp. GP83]|uniref:hypothetical protein n=1 Tax=Planotetraspora sp. GP83 TaxID=3156264 RepID=UPI0035175DBD
MTDDEWSPYDVWRGVRDASEFEVRPEHVKLLRHAYTAWEGHRSSGAPGLDHKRPFGGSHVYGDMAEIVDGRADRSYGDDDVDRYDLLMGELALVLEIVLQAGQLRARPLHPPPQREVAAGSRCARPPAHPRVIGGPPATPSLLPHSNGRQGT